MSIINPSDWRFNIRPYVHRHKVECVAGALYGGGGGGYVVQYVDVYSEVNWLSLK
jgi:hypothetical protein